MIRFCFLLLYVKGYIEQMTLAHRFPNVTALRFEALFWRQAFPGLESSYLLAEDLRTFKTAGLNVR